MSAPVSSRRSLMVRGAGVLAGFAVGPLADAAAAIPSRSPASSPSFALAYEPHSRSLLKAAGTVLQSNGDGGEWRPLPLEVHRGRGGATSVSVAAGGKGVVYVAGPGLGVLRSEPGLRTFSPRSKGLPSADVISVAAHADRPDTVYAYIAGRGIFRSEDGGEHWKLMDAGPRGGIRQFVHSNLPGSMQSGWLFAAGPQGVKRAMDCFCGWRDAGGLGRPIHAVAYEPQQPSRVHAASDTELLSSADGGQTWTAVAAPPLSARALAAGPDGVLYAAAAGGQVFRRAGGAGQWEPARA